MYEDFKIRQEKERKRYAVMAIMGMLILVLGTECLDFLVHHYGTRILGLSVGALQWVSDAAGLSFILWAAMSVMTDKRIIKNAEDAPKKGAKRFAWIYWAAPITALAVLVGFVSNIWSPMAPVIVLLCALLVTVCKLLMERQEK